MFAVIMAVADRAKPRQVDPRPHDVAMLAAFLLVQHHGAGLAGQAELALKPVNRLRPLRIV
jgi:hypothetical protein